MIWRASNPQFGGHNSEYLRVSCTLCYRGWCPSTLSQHPRERPQSRQALGKANTNIQGAGRQKADAVIPLIYHSVVVVVLYCCARGRAIFTVVREGICSIRFVVYHRGIGVGKSSGSAGVYLKLVLATTVRFPSIGPSCAWSLSAKVYLAGKRKWHPSVTRVQTVDCLRSECLQIVLAARSRAATVLCMRY